MTREEEILVEQLFRSYNMDSEMRNFYLNLLLHSKELTDSDYNLKVTSPSRYDLVFMSLYNEGCMVKFDGAISNNSATRFNASSSTSRISSLIVPT